MLNNKDEEARYLSYEEIPYVLNASKVKQVLGLPRTTVLALMKAPGFPVICFGKAKIVKKDDLFAWLDRYVNRGSPNTNQQNKKNKQGEKYMNEEKKQKRFSSYESVPLFLSGTDVSNLLGLSRTNVYYLFREKDFPAITIGKRVMVRREKLFAWIDAHEKATTEHPQHPFQKQTHQQQSKQKGIVKNGNY